MIENYKQKAIDFLENKEIKNIFLFVTATDLETDEFLNKVTPLDNSQVIDTLYIGSKTYNIGKFGNYNIVHVMCGRMGMTGRDASINTISEAIDCWTPCGVIMVGIAFGNKLTQKIGNVLVSTTISDYESVKISNEKTINRSLRVESGKTLLNRFQNVRGWQYKENELVSEKVLGEVISGEKLIDDENTLNQLLERYPEFKGGDMEGFGLYSACSNKNISEWILVKGVCDFADGNKSENKDENQLFAVRSAIDLCITVFRQNSFDELCNNNSNVVKKKSIGFRNEI